MTELRAGWEPFMVRRQQGLSKMMACSFFLHLFLFLFIILNRAFFGSQTPSLQGFQVSLIGPGGESDLVSEGGGSRGTSSRADGSKSMNEPRTKSSTETEKQKAVTQAAPPLKQSLPSETEAPSSGSRAPRSAVNAPLEEKEDPERLQEWWKKQKQALKTPTDTPGIKPKMGVSGQTRTAKIDIQKRPVEIPPVASSPLDTPLSSAGSHEGRVENQKPSRPENALKGETSPSSPERNQTGESAFSESSSGQEKEGVSIQASVGPGIRGEGISGGSTSFPFPSYLQKVDHKIRWQWAPPPVTSRGDRLVIRFMIRKDGGIDKSSVKIQESSGNDFFDQAAMRAVYAAHPLPPLPNAFQEDLLTVFMNFVVKEDS